MIKLLLLSRNTEAVSACKKAFEALGVCCEWTDNIVDMHQKLLSTPFNGLVLDVLTTAKTSQKDRALIQEVSEYYPTLLMRWNSATQKIGGMVFGEILDKKDPLGDFVSRFCRAERALLFREDKRHDIHLNVLLSLDKDFSEELVEKTVTLDLSRGGCFIISSRSWENIDQAWIRLLELIDPTPIQVQLCRYVPWGKQTKIPGIGIKFIDLQPGQRQEIYQYCDDSQTYP
jgi:Tfp pilus assembly protein PilZ